MKHITFTKLFKKNWMKPFTCLLMIAILFYNSSISNNEVAQAATNPLAYYQKLEKANLNKQVDVFTKAYTSYITKYQSSLNQQIGQETTIQATLDPSITDGTSMEGLKSVKATITSMIKGKNSKTSTVISCNDQDLTSIETFTLEDLYYILIPDLSKAYLMIDAKSLQGGTSSLQTQKLIENYLKNPISEASLNQLTKKYGNIVINNIDKVTMDKNVNVTVDGIKSKDTRLTVSINEKNLLNISKAILETAKKDTDLIKLCNDLSLCTEKEYNDTISEGLTSITDELNDLKKKKSNGDNVLKMDLWVNSKGEIAGRSFKIYSGDETVSLGYRTTKSGLNMGVEAWISENNQDVIRGTGRLTAGITGASGNFKIALADTIMDTSGDSSINTTSIINIEFKNVKYTKNDTGDFINGEFTVTGNDFEGMSFNIKCTGDPEKQDYTITMLQNNKSVAVLSVTIKKIPFQDFSTPTSNDKIYDITQVEEYINTSDLKGFLERIKAKTNIGFINTYIDQLLANLADTVTK